MSKIGIYYDLWSLYNGSISIRCVFVVDQNISSFADIENCIYCISVLHITGYQWKRLKMDFNCARRHNNKTINRCIFLVNISCGHSVFMEILIFKVFTKFIKPRPFYQNLAFHSVNTLG